MSTLDVYKDDKDKSLYFNLQKIETEQDVHQYLDAFFANPSIGDQYCFRCVKDASFKLYSSLQRRWIIKGYSKYFKDIESYIRFQISKASKDKWLMKEWTTNNEYSILALIQHYAGRSNLLDFSYNPRSSMFFAFDDMTPYQGNNSLGDYVSMYVIDWSHQILAGVKEVYEQGIKMLKRELIKSGILANQIDASSVLTDLKIQPFDKIFDGKIVHGGTRSMQDISIPYFSYEGSTCISNPNLKSQDGCFFQGETSETPFGESLREQHKNTILPIISCYDIKKTLKEYIVATYKIDMDRTHTYPVFPDKEKLEKHIQKLDKWICLRWILNRCRKLQ